MKRSLSPDDASSTRIRVEAKPESSASPAQEKPVEASIEEIARTILDRFKEWFGCSQFSLREQKELLTIIRAALATATAPSSPAAAQEKQISFDEWKQHPYTKVLEESIARDYVPRADVERLYHDLPSFHGSSVSP